MASREKGRYARAAKKLTTAAGSYWSLLVVAVGVLVWLAVGVVLGFPRGWELSFTAGVPTLTVIWLIVIEHTQNHDDLAMQLKLDEVIRALDTASNLVMRIEDNSWDELKSLQKKYEQDPNAAPHEERRRATISAGG